jgi:hypothetical protein
MAVQIRKVVIRNFRGIRHAEWLLPKRRFVCLVGPGDSTKTTLLDAIGLVLSPRWNVQLTDADFYNCNIGEPIRLQVVVGDLPNRLLREEAHGHQLSGIKDTGELVHDPEDGSMPCLVVQLKVTDDLEPAWTVVRVGAEDDGVPISASARSEFGLFRLDERINAHLGWGRGSALARLTAEGPGANAAVTAAHRAARDAVFEVPEGDLHQAAKEVVGAAARIGGGDFTDLRPGLDPTSNAPTSALLLHNERVPLTGYGLGSRRLVSLAIQEKAFTDGALVLIDEVEHGLEPHRLHYLLRHLKRRAKDDIGQVILTTHSAAAVEALQAADISVVRNVGGETVVCGVPGELDDVQGALRAGPSTLLARRVVVCEGKTEMGVVRSFLRHWDGQRAAQDKPVHASVGVCQSDGKGSTNAPTRARVLQKLGYPTLLIIDNDDRNADSHVSAAQEAGTQLVRWRPGNALEDEIVAALSDDGLRAFVKLAADIKDDQAVQNAVGSRLSTSNVRLSGLDPSAWVSAANPMDSVRRAIARAAKGEKVNGAKEETKAWFKQEESGERLGELLVSRWDEIKDAPLGHGLRELYRFVYGEGLA